MSCEQLSVHNIYDMASILYNYDKPLLCIL